MIKILKKFHLILAFIFALPLLVLSISGAKPLEIDEILKIFSKSEPNFNLSYLKIRAEANKAYVISGTNENGEFESFFIDPYTGEISGKNSAEKFIWF